MMLKIKKEKTMDDKDKKEERFVRPMIGDGPTLKKEAEDARVQELELGIDEYHGAKRELTSKELHERMVAGVHSESNLGKATAAKNDANKLQWGLMPYDALNGILRVLMYGAKKYTARNWEEGFDWSRLYNAHQRHMIAWWQDGEKDDPESRLPHLWHAGCCILFLIAHELRGIGRDDRPIMEHPKTRSPFDFVDPIPGFLKDLKDDQG